MWRQQRRAAAAAGADSGARWSLFLSFDSGMQCLVEQLAQRLPEGVVRLGQPVRRLERDGAGWRVDGETACEAVIVALPAPPAARLLSGLDPQLASELSAIPYASSATVSLAYRREDVPFPLDGFGFVVPHVERRALLAGSFSSVKYPGRAPAEAVLLRAFVGGAMRPDLFDLDDSALLTTVRDELASLLGVRAQPLFTRIARWPAAMPQYHVGHLQRLARLEAHVAAHPGLYLAGNAYRGVGIPDCIASGEAAAEALFEALPKH
jgi:oxygen-dependent protoporphyrinogen oxidase